MRWSKMQNTETEDFNHQIQELRIHVVLQKKTFEDYVDNILVTEVKFLEN